MHNRYRVSGFNRYCFTKQISSQGDWLVSLFYLVPIPKLRDGNEIMFFIQHSTFKIQHSLLRIALCSLRLASSHLGPKIAVPIRTWVAPSSMAVR